MIRIIQQVTANTGSVSGTQTFNFANYVQPGHSILVPLGCYAGSYLTSVTDDLGNAFTRVIRSPNSSTVFSEFWYLHNVSGGVKGIKVTPAVATYITLCAIQVAGLRNAAPIASASASIATSGGGNTGTWTGNVDAGALVYGTINYGNGVSNIVYSPTDCVQLYQTNLNEPALFAYRYSDGAATPISVTWTGSQRSSNCAAMFAPALDFAGRRPSRPGRFRRPAY